MGSRQSQAASETTQLRPSSALVIAPPSSRRTQKKHIWSLATQAVTAIHTSSAVRTICAADGPRGAACVGANSCPIRKVGRGVGRLP